jgi:hypothetical protein
LEKTYKHISFEELKDLNFENVPNNIILLYYASDMVEQEDYKNLLIKKVTSLSECENIDFYFFDISKEDPKVLDEVSKTYNVVPITILYNKKEQVQKVHKGIISEKSLITLLEFFDE